MGGQQNQNLIRLYTGPILDSQGCKVFSCGQQRLRSNCADAQTDSCLLATHVRWYVFSRGGSLGWNCFCKGEWNHIILGMRKVTFGRLFSIDTFYSIQWFWHRTAKALIRLHNCTVWSKHLLSAHAPNAHFRLAWLSDVPLRKHAYSNI